MVRRRFLSVIGMATAGLFVFSNYASAKPTIDEQGPAQAAKVVGQVDKALPVKLAERSGRRASRGGYRSRRGYRGRRAYRGRRSYQRRSYRRGRYWGGSSYYYGLPFLAFPYAYSYPYSTYYSYPYTTRRYRGGSGYWHRRCVRNWGYRNSNYYGCMRYHRRN